MFSDCFFREASFATLDFALPDVNDDPAFGDATLDALLGSNLELEVQQGDEYSIRDTLEFGTPYTVLQFEFQVMGASQIEVVLETLVGEFPAPVGVFLLFTVSTAIYMYISIAHNHAHAPFLLFSFSLTLTRTSSVTSPRRWVRECRTSCEWPLESSTHLLQFAFAKSSCASALNS